MRFYLYIFLLLSFWVVSGQAATRSDVNVIVAAEHIRYLSQKIAKDYLYLYSQPRHVEIRQEIRTMIDALNENFNTIATSTRSDSTRDLLKYLEYNRDSIQELLTKKVTKDQSLLMLDYSEVLLEGTNSIAREHRYPFNQEETMLMNIKKYEYLVERLGKFYMASSMGALSQTNQRKMLESQQALEKGLQTIQAYQYPDRYQKHKKELAHFWESSKQILAHAYDMFLPNLVETSSTYFEHILKTFALYHSKSQ